MIRFSGVLGSVTARVSATYAPVGARSLSLRFTEAAVGDAAPSAGLEALLAPASLPRGPAQLALLAFLRAARVALPVPGGGAMSATGTGSYLISFCDHEMMIGRALSGGGLFVFSRAADDAAQGDGLGDGA